MAQPTTGLFASLEAALGVVADKAKAREAAEAAYKSAVNAHEKALSDAQKLYSQLQTALAFVVEAPQNFRP